MVCLLINHPKFNSINEKDKDGETALHYGEYLYIFKLIIIFNLYYLKHQVQDLINWLVC